MPILTGNLVLILYDGNLVFSKLQVSWAHLWWGFRRLLQMNVFRILLVDDFQKSKCCPTYEEINLKFSRMAPNPRLCKRQALHQVIRYSLLRRINQNCRASVVINNEDADNRKHSCLWNRDLTTYFKILYIVRSFCKNDQTPARFRNDASQRPKRLRRLIKHADDLQYQHPAQHPKTNNLSWTIIAVHHLDAFSITDKHNSSF